MTSRILIALGAVLVFGVVNWQILGKETLRKGGDAVYLELAPVDPRSLMQGDYMALNFRLTRDIGPQVAANPHASRVAILKLDDRRVGEFARLDTGGSLGSGEIRFRFRVRSGNVWLGTNAFFFREGEAERYRGARFGEFRVNGNGDAMLVNLRDNDLR
jgi:uncharacterized membrane-anchored protein